MIDQARTLAEGIQNVEFSVGDSENIPYPDAEFDVVMCSASFHHYPNPTEALREFRRVLKPNGRAFVLDTCRDGSIMVFLYDLGHKVLVGDHVRYYHTRELLGFFTEAGFQDMREEFRVQKLFLHGKLLTSLALISACNR